MKRKAVTVLLAASAAGGILLIMSILGIFGKKYVVGGNLPVSGIDHVYMYSSGPDPEDCWHFNLDREDGKYFVRTELYVPDDGSGYARQKDVTEEISQKEFRAVLRRFEGHVYAQKNRGKNASSSETSFGVVLGWNASPDNYAMDITAAEMKDMKYFIDVLITHPEETDIRLLREVEFSTSGDSLGSSSSVRLFCEKGIWYVEKTSQESASAKDETLRTEAGSDLIVRIREIVSSYDWMPMKDLPPSEIFACDAPTTTFSLTFEPYASWNISDTMELSEEASEMWRRVRTELDEAALR